MKVTRTKKKSSLVQEISKALDMSPISFPMRFQTRFLITRNMWRKRTENTQTLFSKVFFDCTNYYFEIDLPKEDKQKGPSKENKHEPIHWPGSASVCRSGSACHADVSWKFVRETIWTYSKL